MPPQGNEPRGDLRRTYLTVRECRADIVHEELCAHPELFEYREDIPRCARFVLWSTDVVEQAVADLAEQGRISEAADGRLCVRPGPVDGDAS